MRARKLTDDRPSGGLVGGAGAPRWAQLVGVAVVSLAVVFGAFVAIAAVSGDGRSPAGPEGESTSSTPVADSSSPDHSETGSDSDETADLTGLAETCRQFIAGWLVPSGADRRALLEPVTVPGFLAQLLSTDPTKVPKWKAAGACQVQEQSAYTVMVRQDFDGKTAMSMLLVVDPEAAFGWRVTSIGQG